ncbi:MAG: DUF3800 domain-containing protein, partial [Candidatus Aenigmarchaeota archaeon]|nr:DUF3800 domain-containing protein [Candidatus Aenigmarchaeota archaeon]
VDESGTSDYKTNAEKQKEKPLFIVGGVIIDEKEWRPIDKSISEFKKGISSLPENFRLHATDLIGGREIFKDIDQKERLKIYEDFLKKVNEYNYGVIFVSINKKQIVDNGHDWSPLDVSCEALNRRYDMFLERQKINGLRVFEKSHKEPVLRNVMEKVKEKGTIFRPEIKFIIGEPLFCSSTHSNFLQMADMILYTILKREADILHKSSKNQWFSDIFKKYIENKIKSSYRYPAY